jgi:hypothetical protein
MNKDRLKKNQEVHKMWLPFFIGAAISFLGLSADYFFKWNLFQNLLCQFPYLIPAVIGGVVTGRSIHKDFKETIKN